MGIIDLYYENVENAERKQSALDDNISWLNCPKCKSSSYLDLAVNTKTGDIFGACTSCNTEVRLTP